MGRACHSHKNARTKGPSPPSISRPTWPSSPTPLPPVPDSPLFPKLPCGRPHNPQWRRLPWRRARALAPRQGHTPQKAQCMASVSSAQPSTNAMHIFAKVQKKCSALFRKVQKKCKVFALQLCKNPHKMQQVHVDKQLVQQKCKKSAIEVQKKCRTFGCGGVIRQNIRRRLKFIKIGGAGKMQKKCGIVCVIFWAGISVDSNT